MAIALPAPSRKGFRRFSPAAREASAPRGRRRLRLVDRPLLPQAGDGELRLLAHREARCRLLLGGLAAAFLGRAGHHRLGFARLGDYARERLGLSAREVQGLASVASRLRELPSLEASFLSGKLSWSQLRLLAAVATPETEAAWLERASGETVRGLLSEIRRDARLAEDGSAPRGRDDVIGEVAGTTEGEETVRFRIRCPARVRVLWRRTLELARRMLGEQATVWRAAEAIAAEGLSAGAVERGDSSADGGSSIGDDSGAGSLQSSRNEGQSVLPDGEAPAVETVAAFPVCGAAPVDGTFPAGGAALPDPEAMPGPALVEAEDISTLDPFALDARMRSVVHAMRRIDANTARELRRVLALGLHRSVGFASFDGYVRERLGMSPSRAWALVRIEKRSREVAALGRAWRSGTLSWVRVQTILPVVSGAGGTRWVDRAREVTVRQLAGEVDRALDAADRQMCARPGEEVADREVTFSAPASVVGLFRDALAAFTPRGEPAGPAGGPAELAKPAKPVWTGLERLLEHACREWTSQPRHRDPVFERDGWRCAVPACSSRRNLHDHHRQFRSRGGTNERSNRVTTCAWHHLRGIHGGLVRVDGLAPEGLLWELGLRPGREPLLVFEGDRYVRGL